MTAHRLLAGHRETPRRAYGILMVYYIHMYVRTQGPPYLWWFFSYLITTSFTLLTCLRRASV